MPMQTAGGANRNTRQWFEVFLDSIPDEWTRAELVVLWQSFGYFDPSTNDGVLSAIAARLRPGGRLLVDLFHPGWFRANQGRRTDVRDPRCRAITNEMRGTRLRSTIEYVDGAIEVMDFELFEPDQLADRAAAAAGLREVERCCWWDEARVPTAAEQRYQMVLERP